jgi:hypothetical protein
LTSLFKAARHAASFWLRHGPRLAAKPAKDKSASARFWTTHGPFPRPPVIKNILIEQTII